MTERSDTDVPPVELNPCPICLGPVREAAYLDQCFHKYCYACIWHWMKVVSSKSNVKPAELKCPLCKTSNFSVIQERNGVFFDRHYFSEEDCRSSSFFTEAHKYRLQCYYCEPADKFNVPRYWKLRKYRQPNRYLHEWMRREIQALIQEEDVEVIVHHVLGVIDSFIRNEQRSRGICTTPEEDRSSFRTAVFEAVKRFLTGRTERFVDEVELFLASELNLDAYDKVYVEHLGWKVGDKSEENEEEPPQHDPIVPYLLLFDDDDDDDTVD